MYIIKISKHKIIKKKLYQNLESTKKHSQNSLEIQIN